MARPALRDADLGRRSACKEIMAVSSFGEFFHWIGFRPAPATTGELALFLRRTAAQSYHKEYHGGQARAIERGYVMIG
jgi:hypothetical protein